MRRKEWSSTKGVALSIVVSPGLFVFVPRFYVVEVYGWKKIQRKLEDQQEEGEGQRSPRATSTVRHTQHKSQDPKEGPRPKEGLSAEPCLGSPRREERATQ